MQSIEKEFLEFKSRIELKLKINDRSLNPTNPSL